MNKYTQPVMTQISRSKAKTLLDLARSEINRPSDLPDIYSTLFGVVNSFYDNLKGPISVVRKFNPTDARSRDLVLRFLRTVGLDMQILRDSAIEVSENLAQTINVSQTKANTLQKSVNDVVAKVESLSLLLDTPSADVFVAGDSFVDDRYIDRTLSTGRSAEISSSGGALTLAKSGSTRLTNNNTVAEVQTSFHYDLSEFLEKGFNPEAGADRERVYHVYEGKYFARFGQMLPAGGQLLVKKVSHPNEINPPAPGLTVYQGDQEPPPAESKEMFVVQSPNAAQMYQSRAKMFDGSSDSFWRIEALFRHVPEGSPESSELLTDELSRGEIDQYLETGNVDRTDFDVTIRVDLGSVQVVNWFQLEPHNFGDDNWLEVLQIQTARSLDENPTLIPGLYDNQYENVITPSANEELTDSEVSTVLGNSRYDYSGQGIWTFPPREARYVWFKIRQRTPTLVPYDIYQYKLVQTINKRSSGNL